jgi:hypothetical protein
MAGKESKYSFKRPDLLVPETFACARTQVINPPTTATLVLPPLPPGDPEMPDDEEEKSKL